MENAHTFPENVDPSKLSLKDRIKFFASKASKPVAPQPAKELSPSRLAASSISRARPALGASSFQPSASSAPSEGVSRLAGAVRVLPLQTARAAEAAPSSSSAPTPAAAAPTPSPSIDTELTEALAGPAPGPVAIAVTLAAGGGAAAGIGARLHRATPTAPVAVCALDPAGAAAQAGVAVGDTLTAIDAASIQPSEEGAVMAALRTAYSSGQAVALTFTRPQPQ